MMDRCTFNSALASSTAATVLGCASGPMAPAESAHSSSSGYATTSQRTHAALYRSVGDTLTHFDIDIDRAELTPRAAVALPSNVQYVWPHPSRQYLYAATSDSASGNTPNPGKVHRLCALRIDTATGALQTHGEAQPLPTRPIHMSLDATGSYAFTAYNNPSIITVHRINRDGTVGTQVTQQAKLDTGIFAHQVLTTPANRAVVFVTRGNDASGSKPEDPGALKLYHFKDGVLTPMTSISPGGRGGLGYGPRHIDFHPTQPWVYVSVERQNKLHMHRLQGDGISPEPSFVKDTLAAPHNESLRQLAGGIHVHPNGRFVYVSNRADSTVDFNGKRVFGGGENSIAVYAINQTTGEPTLIQHADPRNYHVRTFALDPSGRMLVSGSIAGMSVRDGNSVRHVPAALSVFRVGNDGKLEFVRKYEVETGNGKFQWWAGVVGFSPAARA